MSFANVDRSNSTNTTSNDINRNNPIRNICINPKSVDDNKKFAEEIPREFKYNSFWGKLKFWNRASRDRWAWDKIPKDANALDTKFDCRNPQSRVTPAADKASEKLKSDSIDYLDKNRSRMKENDTYTDSDTEDDVIISKRALLAAKMINKIVKSVEDGGLLNTLDDNGYEIKEGAKNVILLPDTKMKEYSETDQKITSLDNYIKGNDTNMKFMDCRKKKLFEHEPRAEDCRQMAIGDCWLQTILIDILNKKGPEPIKKMLKDSGNNVKVRLYKPEKVNGQRDFFNGNYVPRIYTVPKQIPVNNKNISIYNIGARWVHYVQAAVAKSGIRDECYGKNYTKKDEAGNKYRDYSSIVGGDSDLGWHMILGGRIINRHEENEIGRLNIVDEKEDAIYNKVKKALSDDPNNKKLIYMSFNNFPKKDAKGQSGGEAVRKGLVAGHAYSVCGYEEEGGIKYIRLINPWYNRMGRDYGENGKDRGAGKLFAGIGNESFRLKVSTAAKYLKLFSIEA